MKKLYWENDVLCKNVEKVKKKIDFLYYIIYHSKRVK